MRVILNRVPYYFLKTDVKNPELQEKAGIIACLKMAMEYVASEHNPALEQFPSIDELFAESERIQRNLVSLDLATAKMVSYGRMHSTVAWLAHNHGVLAHMEEYKSMEEMAGLFKSGRHASRMLKDGIKKICRSITDDSPVIVSVNPMIGEMTKEPHSILITGFEKDHGFISAFHYHDPGVDPTNFASDITVSRTEFERCWRRISIFVDSI
jgi:transcriptional regulator with PAS, ATPase and Fis domain